MKFLAFMVAISGALTAAALAQQRAASAHAALPQSAFHIAGAVVNAVSNEPVQGAEMTIRATADRASVRGMVTGEDGRFDFKGVDPGKYSLAAAAPGFGYQGLDQHENFSTGVVAGPGQNSEGIVFKLKPDGGIAGKILDEYGEPVRNANVMLFYQGLLEGRTGAHFIREVGSYDDGNYSFSHLPEGSYKIAVIAQPWYAQAAFNGAPAPPASRATFDVAYPLTYFSDTTEADRATPVIVRPGEREQADFTLHTVPAVRVQMEGKAQGNLSQTIFDHTEAIQVTSASDGRQATLADIAPGHYSADLNTGNSDFRHAPLDVTDDISLEPRSVTLSPQIGAVVHLENPSAPAPAIDLELVDIETGESRHGQSNAKGELQFDDKLISPGRYYAELRNQGFHIASIAAAGAKVRGRRIEIPETGAIVLDINIARGMGRVDGVALRDGKPFAGAMVLLVPEDPVGDYTLFRRDQSDSDGTFTLPTVVPGKYAVLALADGWDVEWSDPAVLKPYLGAGTKIDVGAAPMKIQVRVQAK